MTEYDKKYLKYTVVACLVVFITISVLQTILRSVETLMINGWISLIVDLLLPASLIGTLFVVLKIYNQNKNSGGDK